MESLTKSEAITLARNCIEHEIETTQYFHENGEDIAASSIPKADAIESREEIEDIKINKSFYCGKLDDYHIIYLGISITSGYYLTDSDDEEPRETFERYHEIVVYINNEKAIDYDWLEYTIPKVKKLVNSALIQSLKIS